MNKIALTIAALALSSTAFASPPAPVSMSSSANVNGGVAGAAGIAGFGVTNNAHSAVSGGYCASLNGPGSTSGTYEAGNQSFANTSVTFGTNAGFTNTASTSNSNVGNGNNSTSTTIGQNNFTNSGFTVASSTGSENFGSSEFTGSGAAGQHGWSDANGSANSNATGLIGEVGRGVGGFGSFNDNEKSTGW